MKRLPSIGETILQVRGLDLSFGGVQALGDVGLRVRAREICALIGPNGAGKSSLLNCISGAYRPQRGSVLLRGREVTQAGPRRMAERGLARTFQHLAAFKGMSVLDNILTGRHLKMRAGLLRQALPWGVAPREEAAQHAAADRIIDFLGLQAHRHAPAGTLPYGLQKRVDLGRALAMEPAVLLLDEPLAGMNTAEKRDMSRLIVDINDRRGTSIVLIEHDMDVVMRLADHVVVLDHGRKIADGTPAAVRADPAVIEAYLGRRRNPAAEASRPARSA